MAPDALPTPTPTRSPVEALRLGVRHRGVDPHARRIFRLCLAAAGGTALTVLLGATIGGSHGGLWLAALLGATSWVVVARMLLLEGRAVRLWSWWLGLGPISILAAGQSGVGQGFAVATAAVFLLLRRYRPYRRLSSARRALLFLLATLCFGLSLAVGEVAPAQGWLSGIVHHSYRAALLSLRIFWLLTLLKLFLGMRLHFLRLKPKLAVAGMLVALVPLVLGLVLGIVGLFGALGGSRATHGREMLQDWARMSAEGRLEADALFEDSFGEADAPAWTTELRQAAARTAWAPADSSVFLLLGEEVWVLRARSEADSLLLSGHRVGERALGRLGEMLHCRVALLVDDEAALESGELGEGSWLDRTLPFGGSVLKVLALEGGRLAEEDILLGLSVRLRDLFDEFLSGENEFNRIVLIALAAVAGFFFLIELAALFFGMRIAGGITSAVKALHRATERMARGDLDAWIDIPNEDEFGDLAHSFNEMTQAVRLGQEQAVQRERLEQELLMARGIQERLLPRAVPQLGGWEVAGSSQPSRQVGGDYYDFLPLPDGRLGLAVGDVSGKGIPAAMLMANLQASLQGQVIHKSPAHEVVYRVNNLLAASTDPHMFATFVYGVIDPQAGTVTTVNAGHEPPVLCRVDGSVERLRTGGLVLGMLPDQPYREETIAMEPGDLLVLYTDGISEAMGPVGEDPDALPPTGDEDEDDLPVSFFEEERLLEVIQQNRDRSVGEVRDRILAAVDAFTQGTPQSDDITLVVVKRL